MPRPRCSRSYRPSQPLVTGHEDFGSSVKLTATADETSSVAVDEQLYLTDEVMTFRTSEVIPSLRHTHEARACGPPGHKSYVCWMSCQILH